MPFWPTSRRCRAQGFGRAQLRRRIVGQNEAVEHLLLTLFAGGHAIFVGVPGLAKTLLIKTLAEAMALQFRRIQFTPDLMPADLTGSEILEGAAQRAAAFRFVPGPLFANVILADEINRTPAKTQAALLESMQEGQVSQGNNTYPLPRPFHVFATQNPIEQEGTYPLPEAQLDRFMVMLRVDYPTAEEEVAIVQAHAAPPPGAIVPQLDPRALMRLQALVPQVPVADALVRRAVAVVRATRPGPHNPVSAVQDYVAYGAGPRAAQAWVRLAQARALLHGRTAVQEDDLAPLALPVLRHRVLRNDQGEAQNVDVDAIVGDVLRAHFGD